MHVSQSMPFVYKYLEGCFLCFYDFIMFISVYLAFIYFIYDNGYHADAVNKGLFIGLSWFKLPAAGVNSIVWVLQSDPIAKSG